MVEPTGNAEIAALRAALAAAEQRADLAEGEAARVVAEKTDGEAEIARLKLEIEKLKRSGQRSGHTSNPQFPGSQVLQPPPLLAEIGQVRCLGHTRAAG